MLPWPNLMGRHWDMYCITKHIYYCTFWGESLKWEYHSTSVVTFPVFRKILYVWAALPQSYTKDCNLSLKEKRETHFEAWRDISVLWGSLLWQCDGFQTGKCPLFPKKMKHSGLSHRFSSSACVQQSCTCGTSQSGEQNKLLCIVSGKKKKVNNKFHSPNDSRDLGVLLS